MKLVDEGFVADKEDGVSPTDDSGGDDSDGSLSEGDKELLRWRYTRHLKTSI
ncbi:hypothetical protein HanRHA438_Chr00c30g0854931 [Helianthus annuus]|nr:hypothetical protein HanRHA438_Chr00c55g0859211 [Helianthus annuus]KAJ0954057.1 hypothetical protein HanRHA438_Chr00c30g0854931 [Helianthus annuus]